MQARNGHRNVDARNDHRSAHARTQRRGCAVVVGIDADFARYRVTTHVCVREHIAAWTVVCNGVYVCGVQHVTHVAVQSSSRVGSCGSVFVYGAVWISMDLVI